MFGKTLVGRIDLRIIVTRLCHAALKIVRNNRTGNPTEEVQHPDMGSDPVCEVLTPCRLRIRVTACAKNANKDLGPADFPRGAIDHLQTVSAVVDEHLVSRSVGLPHTHIHRAGKLLIQFAKTAVAVTVGVLQAVFLPQQLQGDMLAAKLGMNMSPDRQHPPDFC